MSTNQLALHFRATNVNGYPNIRVLHNSILLQDLKITQNNFVITVDIDSTVDTLHTIQIERYGKTYDNQTGSQDQILEITEITIDGTRLPMNIINPHFKFEFNDQCCVGSCYFGPNGFWTFEFHSPIITWVLDQKILHESQYNQDYNFPWSYKLGPSSAKNLQQELCNIISQVETIL